MLRQLQLFFSHPSSRAIGLFFGINGLLFGTWITRIPEIKRGLDLSEGELGFALFGIPLGAFFIMPLMGRITARLGAGRATLWSAYAFCFSIFLPIFVPSLWALIGVLIVFGLTGGAMDIAMNTTAAEIEQQGKQPIMSTCHGLWSIGGMLGAITGGVAQEVGISFLAHILLIAGGMVVLALVQQQPIIAVKAAPSDEPLFAIPSRALWMLAIVAFCIFLGEGAIADWSTVYLEEYLAASSLVAGLGYAGFAFSMALGRFYGDVLIHQLGPRNIIRTGALIAAVGIAIVLGWDSSWNAVVGFAVAGIGYSCIVPVAFSEAAKVPGMVPGASIAAIGSLGYLGMLIGPPVVGFVAEGIGLKLALGIVGVLALITAGIGQFGRI